MAEVLREALAIHADAFDSDEHISGADLVERFAAWRERAKAVLGRVREP